MAGIVKRIAAVLVSIFWLGLILGLLAGFIVPDLHALLPTPVRELTDPVALRERWEKFTDSLTSGIGFQPPAEPEATETPTPDATLATQPTATPVPETPTAAPPTAVPATPATAPTASSEDGDTPTATETPAAEALVSVSVSDEGQADLRSAPSEDADVIGLVAAGGNVDISGRDATGSWYRLDDGSWIHADGLVDPPLDQVPIVTAETEPSSEEAAPPVDTPEDGPQVQLVPVAALVNADSNLRAGPGVEFDRVGGINFGEEAFIVGISEDGEWYLLESGAWIFGTLITEAVDVPVVTENTVLDQLTPTDSDPVEDEQTDTDEELTTTDTEQTEAEQAEDGGEQAQPVVIAALGANLRAGPGVEYERVDGVDQGQILTIVSQDETGEWLKLEDALWIFAALVENIPANLPVASAEVVETEIDDTEGIEETTETTEETEQEETEVEEAQPTDSTSDEQDEQADEEQQEVQTDEEEEDAQEQSNQIVIGTINTDASLRDGPGLEATIVDSAPSGTQVTIVDQSDDEQWLQLESGFWILASLVDILPADGVEDANGESEPEGDEDNGNVENNDGG